MFTLPEAQQQVQARARAFAEDVCAPRAADIDRTEAYPWDVIDALRDAGFMGMTIPKAYGGGGLSYLDAVVAIEQISAKCATAGRITVESNMGAVGAIMRYGTEPQKRLAADLVLAGDKPAICITEPNAGSAATDMTTRADKRGDTYILNGTKHWITGGGVSRLHLIFARVFDEQGEDQGIGGFISILGESDNLVIGTRTPAMGVRGIPETEVHFRDLELPADRLVVPAEGVRRGFAGLINAYNGQRVGAGTVALGIATGAYELALERSQTREQFGRPICEFQGLQWMLADMATRLAGAQALVYKAAASGGPGTARDFPDPTLAAQAKLAAAEGAIQVTNDALQIFGSAGYGRDLPMERMVRDARMFTIAGGTAQILRTVIAGSILGRKLPQTRDGYLKLDTRSVAPAPTPVRLAAE